MKSLLTRTLPIFFSVTLLSGCGGSGSSTPNNSVPPADVLPIPICASQAIDATVTVTWDANLDAEVNKAGGGYRVYHSTTSGFNAGDAGVTMLDVPYAGGALAPTTADIAVTQTCANYFKVQAYSALNTGSLLSNQLTVQVTSP